MKNLNIKLFLIYILIKFSFCENQEVGSQSLFCNDIQPQSHLDIQQILGFWYGSEIIIHAEIPNVFKGVYHYDTCVTVHISDITNTITTTTEFETSFNQFQHTNFNHRYLSLFWQENQYNIEYILRYNETKRGYWISIGNQKGTMLELQFEQFSGTIQVVKAVRDHIVLTFCNQILSKNLYTIILTREPNSLSKAALKTIHDLIRRKGLTTHSNRTVCRNNSEKLFGSLIMLLLSIIVINCCKKIFN